MTELCNRLINIIKAQATALSCLRQREKDLMEVIRQEQINCLYCNRSDFSAKATTGNYDTVDIKNAARLIKDYCISTSCGSCVFNSSGTAWASFNDCGLFRRPCDWRLDNGDD